MRKITFQHRLEYGALRLGAWLFSRLPIEWASAIMGKLWQWFAPWNARHKRVHANLEAAFPKHSGLWRAQITSQHWNNLGRTFAEGLCVAKFIDQPARVQILSHNILDGLKVEGPGAVFVSLHMGNWELLALAAKDHGLPMAGIYQRASNPLVDAYIRQIRAPLYPGGLHAKKGDAVTQLTRWLSEGNPVCMMGDLRYNGGVPVSFFGAPAPSNPFPALLAHRANVPLIAARCIRKVGAHFEIEMVEIEKADGTHLDQRITATTHALHQQFEDWIKDRPAQWMWGTKRR